MFRNLLVLCSHCVMRELNKCTEQCLQCCCCVCVFLVRHRTCKLLPNATMAASSICAELLHTINTLATSLSKRTTSYSADGRSQPYVLLKYIYVLLLMYDVCTCMIEKYSRMISSVMEMQVCMNLNIFENVKDSCEEFFL